ncbi:MAG: helix-turn-helix transcriptional regulator [Pseudonocardiales bacterium]|nr:helix-turn-helix transcriptional regulator [Pseudonocardiales bacterium]
MTRQHRNEPEDGWLRRDGAAAVDDAGSVVLAWRMAAGRTQTDVASRLGTTQQHLSQIETGQRPVTLELRRRLVTELGIAAEDLGLSSGCARKLVSRDDASPQIAASRLRWREERHWLNQHRRELGALVARLYPVEYRLPHTTVIAPVEWLLSEPVELGSLALRLDEAPRTVGVDGSEPESAATRPLRTAGVRFERYTSAIKHLSPPTLFWNSPSYRLLDASLASRRLEFALAAYFDRLDVCEALGHEIAAVCMAEGLPSSPENLRVRLPFRELVGDPFDLHRRAVNPGFATLTIRLRRYPAEPSFLLHWRDPAKVATAGGVYSVIPTGEFEPSSVALWDRRNDFDLWRNIVREYSEELLGESEHDGTRSQPIDYEQWSLFQRLQLARANGSVSVFFLGLGLDALTLTAGMLTVMVIDDDVFTELFGSMVRFNEEGEIVTVADRTPIEGVPFTDAAVRRMLETEPMAESGSACLALAWRHRDALGL